MPTTIMTNAGGQRKHRRAHTLGFSEAGDGVGGPPEEATFKVQVECEPYLAACTNGGGDSGEQEVKLAQRAGQAPKGQEVRSQ